MGVKLLTLFSDGWRFGLSEKTSMLLFRKAVLLFKRARTCSQCHIIFIPMLITDFEKCPVQPSWSHGIYSSSWRLNASLKGTSAVLVEEKACSFNFSAHILPADTCSWSSNFMVISFILYPSGYSYPPVADSRCWNKIFQVRVGLNHLESLLCSEESDTFGSVSKDYRFYLENIKSNQMN